MGFQLAGARLRPANDRGDPSQGGTIPQPSVPATVASLQTTDGAPTWHHDLVSTSFCFSYSYIYYTSVIELSYGEVGGGG